MNKPWFSHPKTRPHHEGKEVGCNLVTEPGALRAGPDSAVTLSGAPVCDRRVTSTVRIGDPALLESPLPGPPPRRGPFCFQVC